MNISDKNDDGSLTEDEFITLPLGDVDDEEQEKLDKEWQEERRKEFREQIDKDNNGKITKDELKVSSCSLLINSACWVSTVAHW